MIYEMDRIPDIRSLRRLPRANLATQAYESIVEAIIDRHLEPGTRLNIEDLAKQLDMSATPIREALAHAAGQRLVMQRSNHGFTVAPLLSERKFGELFDVRHLLETYTLGCAELNSPMVGRLEEIVGLMPTMEHGPVYRDFREFNQADREFHHILVSMARNTVLTKTWEDLHFHLQVGRFYAGAGVIDFGDALREHVAIVEALRTGDKEAAARAVSHHIKQAEDRLKILVDAVVLTTQNGVLIAQDTRGK